MVAYGVQEHELPDMDPTSLALAYLAAVIETEHPGALDTWVALAENEALHAEIRRLREPPRNPAVIDALRRAAVLTRHVRFVALAFQATERRERKKHRG